MKPFLPFLLIPALSLGGWGLSMYGLSPERLALPAVLALDAPPALGVVVPANDAQEVVRVPVNVLLPPSVRVPAPRGQTALRPPGPPEVPLVAGILVDGSRKVAQVNGQALTVGESHGLFKVVAIESQRVQFDHPDLRQKRWVEVLER
ncbi:hypothetical protein [Limnohabitans sp. WS1]|jgi:hypothetical protein|uniref:hypothetical protein n=1 Tax=Limnohabitans sp. WS1 TaxID=1100726 RepID=UPI000BDB00DF|nr:hypothetical protein [Limnohabitans sp. WS1]OYU12306.1 MAG: hypothetical protein CFE38_07425 [Comamonadaceae bacterium PBBC1]PUE20254.1 hypothetical protein B9Z48_04835 [Limnohabitans sp. WS1]